MFPIDYVTIIIRNSFNLYIVLFNLGYEFALTKLNVHKVLDLSIRKIQDQLVFTTAKTKKLSFTLLVHQVKNGKGIVKSSSECFFEQRNIECVHDIVVRNFVDYLP